MHLMESRPIRRALCFLLLWGIIVLAILQFRNHPTIENLYLSPDQNIVYYRFRDKRGFRKEPDAFASLLQNFKNVEPKTDRSPNHTEDDIIYQIQKILPNLPISYWNRIKNKAVHPKNETCAKFPSVLDLEFNNLYWQTLHSSNGTFHLYGAYYDVRKLSRIGPAVRILGMIDRIEPTIKTYCQFWFSEHTEPVVVKTMEYKYIWYKKWGNYKQGVYQPYLIACQIPKTFHHLVPISVSLVERICDTATNNLRVIYNKAVQKEGFAVCVKGLDFLYNDLSVRLIEWIELLNILGADKIFFYELHVHANVSKVLNYYVKEGKVEVTPITLPGGQPNLAGFQHLYLTKRVNHKRQNELIPYNDCLYRNMYRYEYIVLLDIDEVIMPVQATNWRELMDTVLKKALAEKNETRASYNVRNVYFLDDFIHSHGWFDDMPPYMHMLQHVYRSKNFTKPNQYIKCFHNPERALTLHNHFPLACLSQGCTSYSINTADAQLQHYRADCVKTLKKSCDDFKQNSMIDTTIWRYKDSLINRTMTALHALGFFEQGLSE